MCRVSPCRKYRGRVPGSVPVCTAAGRVALNKAERMVTRKNAMGQDDAAGTANEPVPSAGASQAKVKFEVFGEEMLEKEVKLSGNSGRVYLPPDWVGHRVKIIRID